MKLDQKKERVVVFGFLVTFLFIALFIIFHTQNSFGGGDPFSHFRIARWSWKYPKLFFDSWGKPVYTILVSPFAQLGMNFARLYNVLMGLLTAFLAWKLSRELKLTYSWLVVLLVLFTPIYFSLMFAALTEVTFSMLLVLSLLLFFRQKYLWSAVVISFLPLVRTESIVLFPIFLVAFGLKKQWKVLPFFTVGFFLISLLGRSFYHSFWWLITEMPYKGGATDIYGHGNLFHFILQTKHILGYPIAGLFCVGLFTAGWWWIKRDRLQLNQRFYFLLLILRSYLLYLAAHSFVWWRGMGNSLGLIRVIGAVTPLAAITALSGFDVMAGFLSRYGKVAVGISVFLFLWILHAGATDNLNGFKKGKAEQLLGEACGYLQQNGLDKHKIFYFSTYIPYKLGIDPFDQALSAEGLPPVSRISDDIPDSSIIVWDSHFGPNEGRTPLNRLFDDTGLTFLKVFNSQNDSRVRDGSGYSVCLFQKKEPIRKESRIRTNDFEDKEGKDSSFYSRDFAHSGSCSLKMDSLIQFSPAFRISYHELNKNKYNRCQAEVWVYPVHPLSETPCSLVINFENKGNAIKYQAYDLNNPLNSKKLRLNHWNKIVVNYFVPKPRYKTDQLVIYIWNRGKKVIYFDDLKVELFAPDK